SLRAKYSVRYVDWEENQFTLPVVLTDDRIRRLQDFSITELRLHFDNHEWIKNQQ
ncbi:unnamed protein product, partial [marine sediment metagenome]